MLSLSHPSMGVLVSQCLGVGLTLTIVCIVLNDFDYCIVKPIVCETQMAVDTAV